MKYRRISQLIALVALAMDGGAAASASRLRSNRSVVLPPTHDLLFNDIRGGGSQAIATTKSIDSIKRQTLNTLHQTSFLMVAATSMVVFAPLPSLTAYLERSISTSTNTNNMTPQAKAVQILSILSAVSAAIELFLSPLVGVVIDTFGRRLPMTIFASVIGFANLGVVVHPSIVTICISRMVNVLLGGFLVIIANAVIADLFTSSSNSKNDKGSEQMGGVLGRQAATVSLGFLFGSVAGGRLTEYGERIAYGSALIFSTLATLNTFRMRDSLQFTRDTDKATTSKTSKTEDDSPKLFSQESARCIKEKLIEAPLSSIQLLYVYGKRMRTLALLLMLQSIPIYMGDVFQMFAKEEWGLSECLYVYSCVAYLVS